MATIQRPRISPTVRPRREMCAPATIVVIDESDDGDVEALASELDGATGPVEILVTRHRPPSPVFASSAGVDGPIMWSQSYTEHIARVRRTDRLLDELSTALDSMGLGPVTTVDCMPSNNYFKSAAKRQIDGVIRALGSADIHHVVIDPSHEHSAELQRAVIGDPAINHDIALS